MGIYDLEFIFVMYLDLEYELFYAFFIFYFLEFVCYIWKYRIQYAYHTYSILIYGSRM